MKLILVILLMFITVLPSFSQQENKVVRKGNSLYQDGKYKDAEIAYRKALEKEPRSVKGSYNLGNSLYKQENYEEAANNYNATLGKINPQHKNRQSAAFHNLGNSLLKGEKYPEAIEAYKQALRLNPADEDTRYNLSYALNKMQQQQQNQQSQKDNKDNKDKNDKQEQKSQPDSGDQQENEDSDQQQKAQLSKKDAERMLQALNNDEQKTMDKVNKKKVKQVPVQLEKDW